MPRKPRAASRPQDDSPDATPENPEAAGQHAAVRQRHGQIMAAIAESGFVTIADLSRRFGLTPQTVRRDLNRLSASGAVKRYHGGAGLALSTENLDYADRQVLFLAEKQRIAALLAQHIPARSSLFINIGTTNEEVAKALANHDRLKVITNNLNVAKTLSACPQMEVIVAGGVVRHRDGGIVGEAATEFLSQFKVDFGVIGISGIDADGTLLDYDFREVRAARAIIQNSRQVFLVTDHSKFGRSAMVRLGHIGEVQGLFTDQEPPAPLLAVCREAGVTVRVAPARPAAR